MEDPTDEQIENSMASEADHSMASEADSRMQMAGALFGSLFNMIQESQNQLNENDSVVVDALKDFEKENHESFEKIRNENQENFGKILGELRKENQEGFKKFREELHVETKNNIEDFKEEVFTILTSPSILFAILFIPGFSMIFQLLVFCKNIQNTLPYFCFLTILLLQVQKFDLFYILLFGIISSLENLEDKYQILTTILFSSIIYYFSFQNPVYSILIGCNLIFPKFNYMFIPIIIYLLALFSY